MVSLAGSAPARKRDADQLVERVVTTDVLAQAEQFAGAREEGGGVQAARRAERVLLRLQARGQLVDQPRVDREAVAAATPAARPSPAPRARSCRTRRSSTSCRSCVRAASRRLRHRRRGRRATCWWRPCPCRSARSRGTCARDCRMPSVNRKPAASSKSSPGVRIVIDTGLVTQLAVHDPAEADLQRLFDGDRVVRCRSRAPRFESLRSAPGSPRASRSTTAAGLISDTWLLRSGIRPCAMRTAAAPALRSRTRPRRPRASARGCRTRCARPAGDTRGRPRPATGARRGATPW